MKGQSTLLGASPSDVLVSYPGHSLHVYVCGVLSAEMQPVYYTVPANWARFSLVRTPFDSMVKFQSLAQFPVNYHSYPVVTCLLLPLCESAQLLLLLLLLLFYWIDYIHTFIIIIIIAFYSYFFVNITVFYLSRLYLSDLSLSLSLTLSLFIYLSIYLSFSFSIVADTKLLSLHVRFCVGLPSKERGHRLALGEKAVGLTSKQPLVLTPQNLRSSLSFIYFPLPVCREVA